MTVDIRVPSVGESISEGIIARWLKKDGDVVKTGDSLFELETDKATTEVPAPSDGVLAIGVKEGSTVAIGSVIGQLAPAPPGESVPQSDNATPAATKPIDTPTVSPSARQLAADAGVNLAQIAGTGREGRILKEDVVQFLDKQKAVASPARHAAVATPVAPIPTAPSAPDGRETRVKMTTIRQRIAARLVEAQQTAAILTTFNEIDMSAVMTLRAKFKEAFQKKHGVSLGFLSFFVKASVEALKAFPAVNARIDGSDIVYNNYHDIGVAVSTEKGLMVPVVRDCDGKSFAGIEKAIAELAEKARDGKITVPDLQGGTFTITNGGVFGSLLSTPILNPPQSGILGMHTIQKRPIAVDDQVVIRPMMYVALSYDHRLIDGREAVGFLIRVKECVENPERMLLAM